MKGTLKWAKNHKQATSNFVAFRSPTCVCLEDWTTTVYHHLRRDSGRGGGKEEALHKIVGLQNRTWLLIEHVEKYTERQVETFFILVLLCCHDFV